MLGKTQASFLQRGATPSANTDRGQSRNVSDQALGGFASGVVGTIVGIPLDLIKTRMQTSTSNKSMGRLAQKILKTEGVASFFKGVAPPLVSQALIGTVGFSAYTAIRNRVGAQGGWDIRNAFAAFCCGPVTALITTVENLIRTQMQVDNIQGKKYRNSLHCVTALVRANGPSGLFVGNHITTLRDGGFMMTYFFTYEGLKVSLMTGFNKDSVFLPKHYAVPLAGGISGACAWFVSFPFDCVRAGVHSQPLLDRRQPRKTARQVFANLMETRGFFGLYKGVYPTIVRAFLVSSTRFSAYEGVLWLIAEKKKETFSLS